jgi:hypothetical protein
MDTMSSLRAAGRAYPITFCGRATATARATAHESFMLASVRLSVVTLNVVPWRAWSCGGRGLMGRALAAVGEQRSLRRVCARACVCVCVCVCVC